MEGGAKSLPAVYADRSIAPCRLKCVEGSNLSSDHDMQRNPQRAAYRAGLALGGVALLLALASAGIDTARYHHRQSAPADAQANPGWQRTAEWLDTMRHLFDVGEEANIPTWYASILLAGAGALFAAIGRLQPSGARPATPWWYALAVIFILLSIDEAAMLHERIATPLGGALRNRDGLGGLFSIRWTVVYAPLVVLFALVFLRFLLQLPWRTRVLLTLAGFLFACGALGIEMIEGVYTHRQGRDLQMGNAVQFMLTLMQETLEMLGSVMLIYALLDYLGRHVLPRRSAARPAAA